MLRPFAARRSSDGPADAGASAERCHAEAVDRLDDDAFRTRGRPRLDELIALAPALRAELQLRARRSGLVVAWTALFVLPAWTVVDRLLAPAQAGTFLAVRLACDVPIALCLVVLARLRLGAVHPEPLTFLVLAMIQGETAWMLPRVSHVEYYLLGSTLVLYASGGLLVSRPRYTAALVAVTGVAVAVAVVPARATMPVQDVVGTVVLLATAALIALVASVRRHRLDSRALLARIRLEWEQENSRSLLARLERLSTQDMLTGVANRRQWDAELTQVCERARRNGTPVALLLLDLDHFKGVNDRHGHPAGDVVLRQVAGVLTTAVRDGDVVARLGGDELSVLLPHTSVERAVLLAERLRAKVAELRPTGFGPGEVTVSLGVAGATGEQAFPMELMARADQQLYRAKITRNCVGAPEGTARVPSPRPPADSLHPAH
ncbi:MAG: diguanylate cyclase [Kineosporiaceae bacterium]